MAPDLERSTVLAALRAVDGNVGRAARELGCSRRTLQNRMREFGIPKGRAGRKRKFLPYARRRRGVGLALGAATVLASALVYGKLQRR